MRTFTDASGQCWDVAVSEESYGTLRLLFAARKGGTIRGYELAASSRDAAERTLLDLSEAELRGLLADAVEWRPG
jgi:hypothetical protein